MLVQHLAPDRKRILTDLVRRFTRMSVFEVDDASFWLVYGANCFPRRRRFA